jgi:hypothetical protein
MITSTSWYRENIPIPPEPNDGLAGETAAPGNQSSWDGSRFWQAVRNSWKMEFINENIYIKNENILRNESINDRIKQK